MFCSNCGKEVDEGVIFCSFCGVKINNVENTRKETRKLEVQDILLNSHADAFSGERVAGLLSCGTGSLYLTTKCLHFKNNAIAGALGFKKEFFIPLDNIIYVDKVVQLIWPAVRIETKGGEKYKFVLRHPLLNFVSPGKTEKWVNFIRHYARNSSLN